MLRRMEMLGRVPILRIVAATDVCAGPAQAPMDPGIAELEALLATASTRPIGAHKIQMTALPSHETYGARALAAGGSGVTPVVSGVRSGALWPDCSVCHPPPTAR